MLTSDLSTSISRSYLFMGKPGTKKTLTLKTFMPEDWTPEKPPWAYIFAFDRKKMGGMAVLQGVPGIEYDIYVDRLARKVGSLRRTKGDAPLEPKAIEQFITKFNHLDDMVVDGTFYYSLVAIDTVTGMAGALFDEIMYKHRTLNPEVKPELLIRSRPALNEIGDAQWHLMDYVKNVIQLPCTTVVVAHTAFDSDSDGNRRMFPKLPGSAINDDFLSMFDEVYHFESGVGTTDVKVRTAGTLTIPARTSTNALDTLEVPDFKVWKKKMEGNRGY